MGTRNLTVVVKNGARKVAQYGQWDGYPEGQGADILAFLSDPTNVEALSSVVDKVRFIDEDEYSRILAAEQPDFVNKRWFTSEESDRLNEIFPSQSRDLGGKILEHLVTSDDPRSLLLTDSFSFGEDSLFCEWAYVVNLDARVLDVYTGFQKERHSDGIWARDTANSGGYYGVRRVVGFALDALPDRDTFLITIQALLPEEED